MSMLTCKNIINFVRLQSQKWPHYSDVLLLLPGHVVDSSLSCEGRHHTSYFTVRDVS